MDRLRTLLLSRARTVVLDPDRVANAATRPSRDVDAERFEDDLAQLGFVMSLDLAMTLRRLPHQAIQDTKAWILTTLTKSLTTRPQVPITSPDNTGRALYLRRISAWLVARPEQPCPWCGEIRAVNALDPCGHLVCPRCWSLGSYAGCPICHRRIAVAPFATPVGDPVVADDTQLHIVHLAFDASEVARVRFERLLATATPLSLADREEIETVIDVIGPRAAIWMPSKIPIAETKAIAVARLWLAAPDRPAMVKATQGHLRTATDVLRVAVVLMGGAPSLEASKLRSLPRGLRTAVLSALDRLPPEKMIEDVTKRAPLWKRVGERLHPFELASKLPNVALAFATIRGSNLRELTFADELRARAPVRQAKAAPITGRERVADNRWARPVEEALHAGDIATAISHLALRPKELLRRVDHLLRVAGADESAVVAAVRAAVPHGAPTILLALAAHVRARLVPWPRRVCFSPGRAWRMPDARPPLRAEAFAAILDATRGELLARAEHRKHFARAVLDRALTDLQVGGKPDVPIGRPTLWDVAAIHAAARANVIYVRERDGSINSLRRRDDETPLQRLARLYDNPFADSVLSKLPQVDAPTWVALVTGDVPLPKGSAGLVLSTDAPDDLARCTAADLIAELRG